MHANIKLDRASKCPKRYLHLEYKAQQGKKLKCPSQTQWPIQYLCIREKVSSWFKPVARPALLLVFAKFVKNWQTKCAKFFDTNDFKLNLKLYIRHRNATLEEIVKMPKKKKIIILKRT